MSYAGRLAAGSKFRDDLNLWFSETATFVDRLTSHKLFVWSLLIIHVAVVWETFQLRHASCVIQILFTAVTKCIKYVKVIPTSNISTKNRTFDF